MLPRRADGRKHLLQSVVGDGSNFFLCESFDRVQNEYFAIGTLRVTQRNLHQLDQLSTRRQQLRTFRVTIGDGVFFPQPVVGLMKLQPGLVAGLDILYTVPAVE